MFISDFLVTENILHILVLVSGHCPLPFNDLGHPLGEELARLCRKEEFCVL
jgi:hypothetical protein